MMAKLMTYSLVMVAQAGNLSGEACGFYMYPSSDKIDFGPCADGLVCTSPDTSLIADAPDTCEEPAVCKSNSECRVGEVCTDGYCADIRNCNETGVAFGAEELCEDNGGHVCSHADTIQVDSSRLLFCPEHPSDLSYNASDLSYNIPMQIKAQLMDALKDEKFKDAAWWFGSDEDPLVDWLMTDTKIHSIVFLGFMIHTGLVGLDLITHLLPPGTVGWWVRHIFFGSSILGAFLINLIAVYATYAVQAANVGRKNKAQWSRKYYFMGTFFAGAQLLNLLVTIVTFGPLRLIKKYVLDYAFTFIRVVNWACVPLFVTIHVLRLDSNLFTFMGKAFAKPGDLNPKNLLIGLESKINLISAHPMLSRK